MKLLFVDDEEFGNEFLVEDLIEGGIEVFWAQTPDKALEIMTFQRNDIDVILLDIIMSPGHIGLKDTMNGHRTGIKLAELFRINGISTPIVVLSGKANIEQELIDTELIDKVLKKPKSLPEIVVTLNEVVSNYLRDK